MEIYKPPEFKDESADPSLTAEVLQSYSKEDEAEGKPEQFEPETLEDKKRKKRKKIDHAKFNSAEFNEVDTLLTNVEEYSKRIRDDVDRYARNVRNETDLFKSEIELELAQALIKRIEAEKKAEEIIKNAEDTREDILNQGREEGFNAGFAEGVKQHKEQNEENTGNILNLLKELQMLRLKIMQKYEEQIVRLSVLMAKKVVHKELKTDQRVVQEMLKDAMRHFQGMGNIKIKINPVEYDFIAEHQAELDSFLEDGQVVNVIKDANVNPLSPVITSDFSTVDLDLNRQFSEIEERLTDCSNDRRRLFKKS